jgi:hypothetical protein
VEFVLLSVTENTGIKRKSATPSPEDDSGKKMRPAERSEQHKRPGSRVWKGSGSKTVVDVFTEFQPLSLFLTKVRGIENRFNNTGAVSIKGLSLYCLVNTKTEEM